MALVHSIDPKDLATSGWAVIFAPDLSPEIREALRPLLEHRRQQAGPYYKEYTYQVGQTKRGFLSQQNAGPGPADPRKVPYYLLLVGGPETISFNFQKELGIQYAVGRLYFDHAEEYERYAYSVVRTEKGNVRTPPKQVAIFSASNPEDLSTQRLTREIIEPLAGNIRLERSDWPLRTLIGDQATKAELARLLSGNETPALLLAGGHGLKFPADDPRQRLAQGAIVCQDWPGPGWRGPLTSDHYFEAADIQKEAQLHGLIAFLLSDYAVGTPLASSYDLGFAPVSETSKPFISRLPQRMLSLPRGGALGVIGGLGNIWLNGLEVKILDGFILRLLDGHPIGSAMEHFDQRWAELAVDLSQLYIDKENFQKLERSEFERLWRASQTNFLLLGDPAARLALGNHQPWIPESLLELKPGKEENVKAAVPEDDEVDRLTLSIGFAEELPQVGSTPGATRDWVSDEDQDQLGFHSYLKALADLIISNDTQPPLTIGIFGSWGTGKSFLLKHLPRSIKQSLETRGQPSKNDSPRQPMIVPVEFNAWEYNASETIWPSLARKIVDHLEKKVRWKLLERLRLKLRRNLKPQIFRSRGWIVLGGVALALLSLSLLIDSNLDPAKLWAAIFALGGLGIWKILSDTLNNSLGQWIANLFQERAYGRPLDLFQQIRDDLVILDGKLKIANSRVLILVDDLDRCEPSKIVEMLQAVKLLLDFESFIVCLAVDTRIVTRAVEKHYSGLLGEAGASGYEYLDKIIQIPFRIPAPLPDDVSLFIGGLMNDPQQRPIVSSFANAARAQRDSPSIGESTVTAPAQTMSQEDAKGNQRHLDVKGSFVLPENKGSFTYEEFLAFLRLRRMLRPNPRHLKRLVNVYRLVRSLARYGGKQVILGNPAATIAWIVICAQWPYTAHLMMMEFKRLMPEGETVDPSLLGPVLAHLFALVKAKVDRQQQKAYDDDPAVLEDLIQISPKVSWEELEIIRRYTINFNPAVELEWTTGSGNSEVTQVGQ